MTWFRVGGAGIPASLKNAMNAVFNKKFGTSGQDYPPKQWPDDVNLMGPLPEGTASGSIANFSDGADAVPCKNVVATIAPTLTGVSSVNVMRTGRNLLNDSIKTKVGESILFAGASSSSDVNIILPAGTYTMTLKLNVNINVNLYLKDIDTNTNISGFPYFNTASTEPKSRTFTLDHTTRLCAWTYNGDFTSTSEVDYCMIECGSTATAYTPYIAPTSYSANLGRTVHGAEVDLVSGAGKVTGIKKTVRWGDLGNVTQLADVTRKEIVLSASEESKYSMASASTDLLNDKNLPYDMTYSGNFEHIYIANSTRIWVYLPNGTDADTEITVSYTLIDALQTDFTFDGQEINSLYGVNNFWNDAGGDTTVVYRRDIDLALQAVSSSRGLMMASRPVTQLVGEQADLDQVNELNEEAENTEEQEGEYDAR